jgi:uncharacterized OB-fold protein
MAEHKEEKLKTRVTKGTWDTKYKWLFRKDLVEKYVAGLKEKRIMGTKCPKCGKVYVPPWPRCGRCFVEIDDWVQVKDTGTLVSYTITYSSITGKALAEPNITGMIRFDGSDSWTLGPIRNIKPEDVKPGMKIKVKWREETKGQLGDIEYYVPAE